MAEVDDAPRRKEKKPKKPYTASEVMALTEPGGWKDAFKLIRRHHIKLPKEMETLEEMKLLLLSNLDKQAWDNHSPATIASQQFDRKRKHILRVYDQLKLLCELPEWSSKLQEEMDLRVRDWLLNLEAYKKELDVGKCSILVAGETGAGKSSFINLLLEEDIMPVDDALSTTSCICEIHHSNEKSVKAFRCDGTAVGPTNLEGKTSEEIKKIIKSYAHEQRCRKSGLEFERVELYWPLPFLSDGVVLVDSPGLGESTFMNERTMHYVHKAVAFIYVLNSEAAGGFTEGRLDDLLTIYTQQKDKSKLIKFDSRSTLFVFNKWDKIKEEVRAKIKDRVLNKIRVKWPNLDEETQVHYLSVKTARNFFQEGIAMPPQYRDFLKVFHSFLRTGLDLTIHHHVRWLGDIMNNLETCVRTPLTNAKREGRDNHKKMAKLYECLQRLRQDTNDILVKLQKNLESKVAEISKQLYQYLNTPEAFQRMKKGMLNEELPTEVLDMELNKALARDLIKKVLMAETSNWEDENHLITKAVRELKDELVAEFRVISSEIQQVEEDMRGGGASTIFPVRILPHDVKDRLSYVFTDTERTVITMTAPLWLPLAMVATAIVTPIVGSYSLISQLVQKHKLAKFEKAREERIVKWLRNTVKAMNPQSIADDLLRELMKDADDYIMAFKLSLPDIILSNKRLIKDIKDKTVPSAVILRTYSPLWLSLRMAMGIRNLYHYEYELVKEENVYEDRKVLGELTKIATGTFADVYKTELLVDSQVDGLAHSLILKRRPVAVKQYRAHVTEANVTDMIIEREVLKKTIHPNIIQLFATVCSQDDQGRPVMMLILELCEETLKEAIYNGLMPGKQQNAKTRYKNTIYVLEKLAEICEGLAYLHENRIVHRDLKLENVLLKGGQVKLADLGHNKAEMDEPGQDTAEDAGRHTAQIVGTPQYTDPCILKKRYVHYEADIYSLSLLMWESWYGQDIYHEWEDELAKKVMNGYRAGFSVEGATAPFQDYQDLIEWCWEGEPFKRPRVETCKEIVVKMKRAVTKCGVEFDLDGLTFTSEMRGRVLGMEDEEDEGPLQPDEKEEAHPAKPCLPGRIEPPRRYHSSSDSTTPGGAEEKTSDLRALQTWAPSSSSDRTFQTPFAAATLPMTSSLSGTTWYVTLPPAPSEDSEDRKKGSFSRMFKSRNAETISKSKWY